MDFKVSKKDKNHFYLTISDQMIQDKEIRYILKKSKLRELYNEIMKELGVGFEK